MIVDNFDEFEERARKTPKIIDFNVAKKFKQGSELKKMTTKTGAFLYRAPELLTG